MKIRIKERDVKLSFGYGFLKRFSELIEKDLPLSELLEEVVLYITSKDYKLLEQVILCSVEDSFIETSDVVEFLDNLQDTKGIRKAMVLEFKDSIDTSNRTFEYYGEDEKNNKKEDDETEILFSELYDRSLEDAFNNLGITSRKEFNLTTLSDFRMLKLSQFKKEIKTIEQLHLNAWLNRQVTLRKKDSRGNERYIYEKFDDFFTFGEKKKVEKKMTSREKRMINMFEKINKRREGNNK